MNATATEIIRRLGGTTKTAILCEVTAQAVSQWHINGIPKAQLKFLRLARPAVFRDLGTDGHDGRAQPQ